MRKNCNSSKKAIEEEMQKDRLWFVARKGQLQWNYNCKKIAIAVFMR